MVSTVVAWGNGSLQPVSWWGVSLEGGFDKSTRCGRGELHFKGVGGGERGGGGGPTVPCVCGGRGGNSMWCPSYGVVARCGCKLRGNRSGLLLLTVVWWPLLCAGTGPFLDAGLARQQQQETALLSRTGAEEWEGGFVLLALLSFL